MKSIIAIDSRRNSVQCHPAYLKLFNGTLQIHTYGMLASCGHLTIFIELQHGTVLCKSAC